MSRARSVLAFSSVRSEGGLLPHEFLQRVASEDRSLPGLTPEAYHLSDVGDRLRDAVNRSWTRLTGAWRSFQAALAKLPEGDPATSVTRERWLLPLFEALSYGRLPKAAPFEIEGKPYPISHLWHKSPIHLVGCRVDLDTKQKGITGASASSPHGLVQDFLNRSEGHLWGFVSNGYVLRVLRDHHSLTQQAYVEFDLQAMMEGESFSEFSLLWLVVHQSRVEAEKAEECWLEAWFKEARDAGVRALDKLRDGVVRAIEALGTGFLRHKSNTELKADLARGDLDKQDYYRQLLRLAYRLIFLFVAEDRDALLSPDPKATEEARARYRTYYSTKRLRDVAQRRRGGPHGDLWRQLRLVMGKLWDGSPELALPALGSFLWRPSSTRALNELELSNEDLLSALRALCYVEQGRVRHAVSWRNMGAEELGSVYESLLELHPEIHKDAARFELTSAAGHERKTTGSYYTPTSLVDCLLDSALDPVLDEAAKKPDPARAILDLKVCDPACGSGHFLVAAARRMALRLATVRSGGDEPSPPEVQRALRDVVGRCIYGVDLNPMAVELCKVSLWMEAIEPGRPLSFLEGHIQQGNALLGATPALMAKGIPDEAFEVIEGDDKDVAKRLKKRNKKAREGQGSLFAGFAQGAPESYYGRITTAAGRVEEDSDGDIGAVRKKEQDWELLTASDDYRKAMFLADAWCAAFVWPKQPGKLEDGAITEDLWRRMEKDPKAAPEVTRREVNKIAREYLFFHWHLAFPQVFFMREKPTNEGMGWTGGFDIVLGNPPWERIKLQEQEFFARRSGKISGIENASDRKRAIAQLRESEPSLFDEWQAAVRKAEAEGQLIRLVGRFPLCAKGDINTYAIFAEHNRTILTGAGRAGFIVPSGIATEDTTKLFFQSLLSRGSLTSFFEFENEGFFSAGRGHMLRFALLTLTGSLVSVRNADFFFQGQRIEELSDRGRHFSVSIDDVARLNPNTRTCPIYRTKRDAEIAMSVYNRVPILLRDDAEKGSAGKPWDIDLFSMFHMTSDSGLFRTRAQLVREGYGFNGNVAKRGDDRCLALYEAKMIYQYNHRHGDYADVVGDERAHRLPEVPSERLMRPNYSVTPHWWVAERNVVEWATARRVQAWMLVWRDVTDARASIRTVIATVVPSAAVANSLSIMVPRDTRAIGGLVACLSSLVLDYMARQKIAGLHLNFVQMKQLPVLSPQTLLAQSPWNHQFPISQWVLSRVLELTYTAWDLEPFAKDCGYDGPPFRWDPERRPLLRAELDAAFFHLYGLSRDDTDYILDTFPIVRKNDEKAYGEYRTKRLILETYDRMQTAITTGVPYRTLLDPPPADPRVAHPPRPTST